MNISTQKWGHHRVYMGYKCPLDKRTYMLFFEYDTETSTISYTETGGYISSGANLPSWVIVS